MSGNDDVVIPLIEKRPTTSSGLLNEALDKLGFGTCCEEVARGVGAWYE